MKPTWTNASGEVYIGDVRESLAALPPESAQTCVTSPPYFGLRDYGVEGQIGLERLHDCLGWATGAPCGCCYVCTMLHVFRLVRRLLRADGTLWLNLGDSFNADGRQGHGTRQGMKQGTNRASATNADACRSSAPGLKPKDLIGIPWRVAFALQADGWYLRSDIVWAKPNCMPESVEDRPTRSHEYLFLLSKSERYYYDFEAIKEPSLYPEGPHSPQSIKSPHGQGFPRKALAVRSEPGGVREGLPDKQGGHSRRHDGFNDRWDKMTREEQCALGRNKRDVWTCATPQFAGAHYATFPPGLIRPCVLAGAPAGGVVLDPFLGSGTTAQVAVEEGRRFLACDLNPTTVEFTRQRLAGVTRRLEFEEVEA